MAGISSQSRPSLVLSVIHHHHNSIRRNVPSASSPWTASWHPRLVSARLFSTGPSRRQYDGEKQRQGEDRKSHEEKKNQGEGSSWLPKFTANAIVVLMAPFWMMIWFERDDEGHINFCDARQPIFTGASLNKRDFVPFTVVSREHVTEDTFVLTVRPMTVTQYRTTRGSSLVDAIFFGPLLDLLGVGLLEEHSHARVYAAAWAHGLWSVEIKQPQLQISREYTPLPPLHRLDGAEQPKDTGDLRFYIRSVGGGEVSSYLSRLGRGDVVQLRGPHLGFDVRRRLGVVPKADVDAPPSDDVPSPRRVVFFAGGTGIAPALQVARALLGDGAGEGGKAAGGHLGAAAAGPTLSIVWANRRRATCLGGDDAKGEPSMSPVVRQLQEMARRHGDRLDLRCVVDEENTFVDAALVRSMVLAPTGSSSYASYPAGTDENGCPYHSPVVLQRTATDPSARSKDAPSCLCAGSGGASPAGRNLVMVSGPSGFVDALAGEKVWRDGQELQGPVRGLLGRLRDTSFGLLHGWLVLKL